MTEPETQHESKSPASPWKVALVSSGLVLVLTLGAGFAARDQLMLTLRDNASREEESRDKLESKLRALQSSLDSLSAAPAPDMEKITALEQSVGDIKTSLEALNQSQQALTKQVAELAARPVPQPEPVVSEDESTRQLKQTILSGEPFANELRQWRRQHSGQASTLAALNVYAERGLPSESSMIETLRTRLAGLTQPVPTEEASGMAGKINTHLKGLVRIRKAADRDPYEALRQASLGASLAELIGMVEALESSLRAPLNPWLEEARPWLDAHRAATELMP